ncbi:hypothetical protein NYO99_11855 [Pelomonas sp. UHG3]|uniref:Uncharacterized protein n=1 Tax=Roseateles hydrophilus TaxID=2975054 RepID=A0ACC6CBF2_9BURK|nr:hypothetical protein [Pelomonas sp. UHG3]MCY4745669.1 hypothetical protein [Pelomonas sp. UHG3]
MRTQLASLAHASVIQLRDTIRRVTLTHVATDSRDAERFLDSVVVKESSWGDWVDTAFDVRQIAQEVQHA